jgi:hypothetical protein
VRSRRRRSRGRRPRPQLSTANEAKLHDLERVRWRSGIGARPPPKSPKRLASVTLLRVFDLFQSILVRSPHEFEGGPELP